MHIIMLTEKRFNEFSNNYDKRNYKQTVEYANFMYFYDYKKIYIGLEDENNNLVAATLILEKTLKGKYKFGYAPNGFLIDFNNYFLLAEFTKEFKKFLVKLNYVYLTIDPNFAYKVYDKNKLVNKYYSNILDNMKKLGYIKKENIENKFNAFLHIKTNINDIYSKFDRNMKRKIKDNNLMGISFYQENDVDKYFNLVKKKKINNLDYYRNLIKCFNSENCKLEIYFSKINPEIYLNNYRYLLKKEQETNYKLQQKISNLDIKKTIKLLNKKIKSDKLLNKYQNKVIESSQMFSNYPDGLIICACIIIKTNNTIYFIDEGYNEKYRNIHSLSMLKWEIIKKYSNENYTNFDLGLIPSIENKSKYYGIYQSKIGFNPKVIEFPGEFDLVINKYIYKLLNSINYIHNKKR